MNPSSTASYSLSWAMDRVNELIKKYARATDFVMKILEIKPRHLALMLAKRDPVWSGLKDLIHRTDVWLNIGTNGKDYYTYVEYIRTHIAYFSRLEGSKRLTGRIQELMIEEQLMKGGNWRLLAENSLPSSPSSSEVTDDGYGPQLLLRFDSSASVSA